MPFKPGDKKPANSGRKKGTLNKQTLIDQGRAEAILELIETEYLEKDIKQLSASKRADVFVALLEFRAPKLARIDNRIQANINLSDQPINFE